MSSRSLRHGVSATRPFRDVDVLHNSIHRAIMTRLPIVACFCLGAAISNSSAQSSGTRSASPPDATQQAVIALFDDFTTLTSPGCAVIITRNGATLFSAGFGLADLKNESSITPRTAFYAASVSKQFTTAAIGLLALRGNSRSMPMCVTSYRRCLTTAPRSPCDICCITPTACAITSPCSRWRGGRKTWG